MNNIALIFAVSANIFAAADAMNRACTMRKNSTDSR